MHALVVTHLLGCVEMGIVTLFLSWHDETKPGARPGTPGFPSKICLPNNTNTISIPVPPGNYRPFKVIKGNTVPLAHSDEPYMQKYGTIRGNPDPTN